MYRDLTGDTRSFHEHVENGKRTAATTILRAEIVRLARLVPDVAEAADALTELVVHFPVYRSYLPIGAEHLAQAMAAARSARPELGAALDALAPRLQRPGRRAVRPVPAGDRRRDGQGRRGHHVLPVLALHRAERGRRQPCAVRRAGGEFHAAQTVRQDTLPRSMTSLSTHDTKRGEDVRARLAVLSELPDEWSALARTLMAAVPVPDPTFGYLLWQTFAGAGLIERDRMHAYAEKAMREAAQSTGWIDPDEAFERTVHEAVDRAYDDPAVRGPLEAFVERITPYGWTNSLAQKLVQLTMPGVPDVYQGTELWEDSLVDPDNRRPLDTDLRRDLLDRLDGATEPPEIGPDGAAKLWVVSRTLRLRRDWPDLFAAYEPVRAAGPAADHVVAFDRGGVVTVATRLPVGLERAGGWGDTVLDIAAPGHRRHLRPTRRGTAPSGRCAGRLPGGPARPLTSA